jgi:hypothetical protein
MTVLALSIDTVQVGLVPVQAPDHALKAAVLVGVAVSVTLAEELNDSVQSLGQAMPAGLEETLPSALSLMDTDSICRLKRATTEVRLLTVTVQGLP